MGRAIETDNRLGNVERRLKLVEDALEIRLKLVEDALEEMIQTRVHHVDLHDFEADADELSDKEEFTPPAGKRKKTTKRKTAVIEKSSAEA